LVELHGAHCTHVTSLPVSTRRTCGTDGVPKPSVTTYSSESTEPPRWVGMVTAAASRVLAMPMDARLLM